MAISHANHDHPSTPAARAKCRKGQGITATVYNPKSTKEIDQGQEEFHPADKERQCYNCRLRLIEWQGITRIGQMHIYVCDKCYYMLDKEEPITYMEV